MTPIKSSNLAAVAHDGQHLTVEFQTGAKWRYLDVAPEKHQALLNAKSAGSYFAREIRPHHKAEKVT